MNEIIQKYTKYAAITGMLVISRLIPHPANFTPLNAVALWGGAKLAPRVIMTMVFMSMLLSDLFIGIDSGWSRISVYFSLGISILIGKIILKKADAIKSFGAVLVASFTFFILTNLAVWAFSGMYTLNLSGLYNCFLLAIPFFRNSLLADVFFSGLIVIYLEFGLKYHRNKLVAVENL